MGRGQPAGGPGSIRNTKVRVHRFAKIALYTRSRIYVEVFKGTSHVLEAAVPGRVAPAAVLGVTGSTGHCPARRRGVRRRRPAGWRRRRSGSACRDRRAAASHGTPGRALGGPLATLQERERVRRALRLSWPPPPPGRRPPPGSHPPSPGHAYLPGPAGPRPIAPPRPPTNFQTAPVSPVREVASATLDQAHWPCPRTSSLGIVTDLRDSASQGVSPSDSPRSGQPSPPARHWSPRRSVPAGFQAHSLPAPRKAGTSTRGPGACAHLRPRRGVPVRGSEQTRGLS